MAAQDPPRVVLFDVGGVCTLSPFQAILDYELSLGIPPGWVNWSISKTAPNGSWHRLERGEIAPDAAFIRGFNADLHDPEQWQAFYKAHQARHPDLPRTPPALPDIDGEALFHAMMQAARSPDPWIWPALQRLRASGRFVVMALSNTVIFPRGHALFVDDAVDRKFRSSFDVFVSSAHVGLRKPDPRIYQLALREANKVVTEHAGTEGAAEILPRDVVFLDDIGENLKEARKQGFRTIKVPLGRAFEAVDELEKMTGLKLAGNHPRIRLQSKRADNKAKI